MVEKPVEIVRRIADFFNLEITEKQMEDIIWKFSRDNPDGDRTRMHLNKAKIYRYQTEITEAQRRKCLKAFGKYLEAIGYDFE